MKFPAGVPAGPPRGTRHLGRRRSPAQSKNLCGERQLAKPVALGEPMYGAQVVALPCIARSLSGDSGTPEVRSAFSDSSKRYVAPLRPDYDQGTPATLAALAQTRHSLTHSPGGGVQTRFGLARSSHTSGKQLAEPVAAASLTIALGLVGYGPVTPQLSPDVLARFVVAACSNPDSVVKFVLGL